MDVYVLKNGERRGPFSAWRLRELLEEKEVVVTDLGWHEGMDSWQPLEKMPALEMWMPPDPALPPPLPSPAEWERKAGRSLAEAEAFQEREGRRVRAWLRLLARTLDEVLFYLIFWIAGVSGGWLNVWDFGDLRSMSQYGLLLWVIPATLRIPVEAALLHWFGSTPGKWLCGISVRDDLGQKPSWGAAFKRSGLVMIAGTGLGLPVFIPPIGLLPLAQGMAGFIHYRRTGSTLWDRTSGTEVHHRAISTGGFVGMFLLLGSHAAVFIYLMMAVPIPAHMPEDIRRRIEEVRHNFREKLPPPAPAPTAAPVPTA